jgi:hypothetical protein
MCMNECISSVIRVQEYRKLAYMFPEYLFLDSDFSICLAGRGIEELLNYNYGSLRNKSINFLSDEDLKSFQVEICGFRMTNVEHTISPIVIHVRRSRNHLEKTLSPEVDNLAYWIAHNVRGPLATLEGLINLAKMQNNTAEMKTYLNYMSQYSESLDEKIRLMVRLAGQIV